MSRANEEVVQTFLRHPAPRHGFFEAIKVSVRKRTVTCPKKPGAISSRTIMTNTLFARIDRRLFLAFAFTLASQWVCADETGARAVTFSLYAPHAKSVEVAGDFNQWQAEATPLVGPDEKGMWRVKVPLPANLTRIEYVYWVDGASRRVDPAQPVVQDEFSGENNVLVLP